MKSIYIRRVVALKERYERSHSYRATAAQPHDEVGGWEKAAAAAR